MAGQPIATINSMHVCPMVTGTVPHVGGPVLGPGIPGILINGQPVAVVGDMCVCAGPPDAIVMGCNGVLANGKPIATVGNTTSHGGIITMGVPGVTIGPATPAAASGASVASISFEMGETTRAEVLAYKPSPAVQAVATYVGVAEKPLLEEAGKGVEESQVTLESRMLLDALTDYAKDKEEAFFISALSTLYGSDILPATYANLYTKLRNGEITPPPIEVVKNYVVGDVHYDPPKPINRIDYKHPKRKALGFIPLPDKSAPAGSNKVLVSEAVVRRSQKDEKAHKALMIKLEKAFTDYILYLLLHELTSDKQEEDEPSEFIDRHIR